MPRFQLDSLDLTNTFKIQMCKQKVPKIFCKKKGPNLDDILSGGGAVVERGPLESIIPAAVGLGD